MMVFEKIKRFMKKEKRENYTYKLKLSDYPGIKVLPQTKRVDKDIAFSCSEIRFDEKTKTYSFTKLFTPEEKKGDDSLWKKTQRLHKTPFRTFRCLKCKNIFLEPDVGLAELIIFDKKFFFLFVCKECLSKDHLVIHKILEKVEKTPEESFKSEMDKVVRSLYS